MVAVSLKKKAFNVAQAEKPGATHLELPEDVAGASVKEGIKPIPGHSMPLAALGVFLLWFGWFGFNGGSAYGAGADCRGARWPSTRAGNG